MAYMLLIHLNDETAARFDDESEMARAMEAHNEIFRELTASGEMRDTRPLKSRGAKVLRMDDGERLISDGPFTESKEWVAGYYIIDVASMDRAIEIASRMVEANYGPIEIREIDESA